MHAFKKHAGMQGRAYQPATAHRLTRLLLLLSHRQSIGEAQGQKAGGEWQCRAVSLGPNPGRMLEPKSWCRRERMWHCCMTLCFHLHGGSVLLVVKLAELQTLLL